MPAALPTPISEFNQWLQSFSEAPEPARAALAADGQSRAARRREFLEELIRTDPKAALEAAVPMAARAQLPPSVQNLLEQRVSGRGAFTVLVATDFDRGTGDVRRELAVNGQRYDAFVYGTRAGLGSRSSLTFHGIAVGNRLAIHENPIRALEAGELVPHEGVGVKCPVSGRPAEAFGTPAAAEVAGRIERFCGAGHINLRNSRLAADEGDVGGDTGDPPLAADAWSQGAKTCLFMRVAFPDDPTEPITEDGAYVLMDAVNQWFVENSYGTTSIIPTVTPLLILPQPKAWYSQNGTSVLQADSRDAARAAGYDTDNFHWDIVRHPTLSGAAFNYGGLAAVQGKGIWLQNSSTGIAAHELGHNYGLWHANFWTATLDSVIGPGTHSEYGNSYDTMGAASAGANQFNAAFKNQLDWLPDTFVTTVRTSGTYRLYTYDVPSLSPGQAYALKVRKDKDRDYWMEFRQKFTTRPWFMNGVVLNWDPWNNGVANSASGTHLLDTTPGTLPGKDDCPVVIGRTFTDTAAGLHFTPVARGDSSPENWIDVVVHVGAFPSNRPPTLVIASDRNNAATNSPINFIATAADPDGDALAYAWDFGQDSFGPNAPFATKSWSSNAVYVVTCTVSDMKGGRRTQQILVGIGTTTNAFTASGRVTTAAGEPLEGVRIHNGAGGSTYRSTTTDSDGYYSLPNLPAGASALSAMKYGYTLARLNWANPITLGPNLTGLDWVATPGTTLSMSVLTPTLNENSGSTGTIRFTRTGPTNTALAVKFSRSGTATYSTDYTLTPAPTGTAPLQYLIPAGATSLNVTVTPVSDTSGEGPEFLRLTLAEDPAYVILPYAEAIVTLQDDDTVGRPSVMVSASSPTGDNLATEGGQDTGIFTFTRSGSIQSELTLFYAVSGTATPNGDYTALAGVAVIPPGETATSIAFSVIDDPIVEINETVIVTLTANAAYTIAGSPATVTIADDDPTTVTITASDNTAREGGGNNGAFTVTRQGSLAANLVVNYAVTGTASNGVDCVQLPGTVTLLAGRNTASIGLTPANDSLVEGPETITCTLVGSPTCNIGSPASATIVILDDEIPNVLLAATDPTAGEPGTDTGEFTFTRTGATTNPLTVQFTVSGTAVPGADYVPLGSSLVIPVGASNATLLVTALDDTFKEAPERILVTLATNSAYAVGTPTPQAVTLQDNEAAAPVAVGFSSATSSGEENLINFEFNVSLSTNSSSTVSVDFAITAGTASGNDFFSGTGRLLFTNGVVSRSLTVTLNNDTTVEQPETVLITLSNPTNAVLDAIATHTFTILDDDISGVISVTANDATASESGGDTARFRISRARTSTTPQTVYFQLAGTAAAGADYLPVGNSAVIPSGASSVDVTITPIDDIIPETNETIVLNITSAPGGVIGPSDLATATLQDNDSDSALPILTVTAVDAAASEPGTDTATFRFRRDRGTNAPLTVTYSVGGTAISGTDFNSIGTSVTIPTGAFETNLVLTVRNDAAFESNETVVVSLTVNGVYRAGTPASATAIIADDESGVTITALGATDEANAFLGRFIINRTGSTASNLPVYFSVSGTASETDYQALGTNAVIPAGTNAVSFPLVAIEDEEPEGNEAVIVTLQAGPGYAVASPSNATVFLLDDEAAVGVTASVPTTYEAGGPSGMFTLSRAGNTNIPLTLFYAVTGTASPGLDYGVLSNSIQFASGVSSIALAVTPLNDVFVEGNETVRLTITPHASYQISAGSAEVTILDDESNLRPAVSILSPAGGTAWLTSTQSMLVLEAQVTDDARPAPPAAVNVEWTQVSGPTAVFENTHASSTTIRFPTTGAYVVRLTANDGELSDSRDVLIVVGAQAGGLTNAAPIVNAGVAQSLGLGVPALLDGSITDDNVPGAVTSLWTQVSGPTGVSFTDPSNPVTTAALPSAGQYVLRLTASDGQAATADDVVLSVVVPALMSVQAVENTASELGGIGTASSGTFLVRREGDDSAALTVRLDIGGTASNGLDYAFLTNEVVFQPGQTFVLVQVTPFQDSVAEGEETVVLSLLPDPGYRIATPGADTVFLTDLPWDDWRFLHFTLAELDDPLVSGEEADPDGDGLKNLFEYSADLDPGQTNETSGFTGAIELIPGQGGSQPGFVVTFKRRLPPRDIRYDVEVSSDLLSWVSGLNATRELLPPIDDGNGITETVRVQILGYHPQDGQKFVRLKITRL